MPQNIDIYKFAPNWQLACDFYQDNYWHYNSSVSFSATKDIEYYDGRDNEHHTFEVNDWECYYSYITEYTEDGVEKSFINDGGKNFTKALCKEYLPFSNYYGNAGAHINYNLGKHCYEQEEEMMDYLTDRYVSTSLMSNLEVHFKLGEFVKASFTVYTYEWVEADNDYTKLVSKTNYTITRTDLSNFYFE